MLQVRSCSSRLQRSTAAGTWRRLATKSVWANVTWMNAAASAQTATRHSAGQSHMTKPVIGGRETAIPTWQVGGRLSVIA
jgi:hypothetical protein